MKLADEFIQQYNTLDACLRKQIQNDQFLPFSRVVSLVGEKNCAVKCHEQFIISMGNLRNAIIHDPQFTKRIIATPDSAVVEEFKRICDRITNPPKAINVGTKNLKIYDLSTSLSSTLPDMRSNDYSQIVVRKEDGTYSLITREGIARWLEMSMKDDIVSLREVTLNDIHPLEDGANWDILSADDTIYDAAAFFSRDDRRIQALIITQNGKKKEKPLGILSFWDISKFFKYE